MENLSMIVAVSDNNVIGVNNKLPWRQKTDLVRFKSLTKGKTVVMGRKTYESIGKALPDRRNIVLSTDLDLRYTDAEVVHSVEEVLDIASQTDGEVIVIGGANVYKLMMEHTSRIYFTYVHTIVYYGDGDDVAVFPECTGFVTIGKECHSSGDGDEFPYDFVDAVRIDL